MSNFWEKLMLLIEEIFGGEKCVQDNPQPMPQPTPVPVPPTPPVHVSRIADWAKAIEVNEGADPRTHNPGNLKYASLTASWGATPGRAASDGGHLCQFSTYEAGFKALCNFLTLGAENQLLAFHKARTLQTFTVVYAGNPPQPYINRIAAAIGVSLTIDVSELL
jgi:hypothetical protein